jgi:hypothetical protein
MYALKLPKGVPVASVQALKKSGCICFKYTAAVDSYLLCNQPLRCVAYYRLSTFANHFQKCRLFHGQAISALLLSIRNS